MAELTRSALYDLRETLGKLMGLHDYGVTVPDDTVFRHGEDGLTFKVYWDADNDEYVAFDLTDDAPGE